MKIFESQNSQGIRKSQRTFLSRNQTLKFARIAKIRKVWQHWPFCSSAKKKQTTKTLTEM